MRSANCQRATSEARTCRPVPAALLHGAACQKTTSASKRPLGRAVERGHGPHGERQAAAPRGAQRGGWIGRAAAPRGGPAPPRPTERPGPAPCPACCGKRGVARAKAERGLWDGHGTAEGLQGTGGPEGSGATTEPSRAEGPLRGRRWPGGCARCARGSRSCRESGRRGRAGLCFGHRRGRSPSLGTAAAAAGRGAGGRAWRRAASSGVVPRGAVWGASLALGLGRRAECCPLPSGGSQVTRDLQPCLGCSLGDFLLASF